VQAGDAGDGPITAVAELGALDGGVPAALLLVEAAEQQVHLPVESPIGVGLRAEALGALALVDFLLGHGPDLLEATSESVSGYHKLGIWSWLAAKCPVHCGSRRNLSVKLGQDGKILLHCQHVGSDGRRTCSFKDIVAALGLRERDMFPAGSTTSQPSGRSPERGKAEGI
jgi:hypothetical protein